MMPIKDNGILVVDLGGVHQRLPGQVSVTGATGTAMIIEGGSLDITGTSILPCTGADPYTGVAFNLQTGNDGNGHTNCTTATCDCRTPRRCGDGFLDTSEGEQCDLGDAINGMAGAACAANCRIPSP